ncbi:hypothetical protein LZ31DRAFT_388178 [Colletotrichum somersetense]|nr:hypothetical protein LZ31DRAFT_388178 [Colletotrichum somersetense]
MMHGWVPSFCTPPPLVSISSVNVALRHFFFCFLAHTKADSYRGRTPGHFSPYLSMLVLATTRMHAKDPSNFQQQPAVVSCACHLLLSYPLIPHVGRHLLSSPSASPLYFPRPSRPHVYLEMLLEPTSQLTTFQYSRSGYWPLHKPVSLKLGHHDTRLTPQIWPFIENTPFSFYSSTTVPPSSKSSEQPVSCPRPHTLATLFHCMDASSFRRKAACLFFSPPSASCL